ncbi:MAG TPA: protease inhibitor I42 family protein [Syntrophomonadaceae bacterium]|nr:protease inhibitor I42 family protein [Syntrophomonadaceae bacterium]
MIYSEEENGQQVLLKAGQLLKIALDSNPTTGYKWTIQKLPDSSFIHVQEVRYLPSQADLPLMGGGGRQYWTLKAVAPGRTSIQLRYSRSWESVPALRTYQLDIEIR